MNKNCLVYIEDGWYELPANEVLNILSEENEMKDEIIEKSFSERKEKHWDDIKDNYKRITELADKFELKDIDKDDVYYHPVWYKSSYEIHSQGDLNSNFLYGFHLAEIGSQNISNIAESMIEQVFNSLENRPDILIPALNAKKMIANLFDDIDALAHQYFEMILLQDNVEQLEHDIIFTFKQASYELKKLQNLVKGD